MNNETANLTKDASGRFLVRLESRNSCALNLSDLIVEGRLQVFPHVEEKGLLFVQFRKSKIVLSAGPYIGLIPLTPSILVEVRPKMPVVNLARILDTARNSLASLTDVDRFYKIDNNAGNSVFEFLSANLIDASRPIIVNGLHKDYVSISETTSHPRGRIDLWGTYATYRRRGRPGEAYVNRFEQTSNLSVNRLIKSALELVLTRTGLRSEASRALLRTTKDMYLNFPSTIQPIQPNDITDCREVIQRLSLPAIRSYYYRAIDISLLLLSNRSVSLQERDDDVVLGTFIVNFEELFEDYLRRVLQDRCDSRFWVRDGNREARKSLFDDRKEPPAQPDIVITDRESRRRLVAEVKYKDRPNRDDINQAITYATSYRAKDVILIHQKGPGRAPGLQKIGTVEGIVLSSYAFDLTTADLEAEEERMAMCLFALIPAG
jgi:5-methylcytosine-specific restriction enzyme subunit McrC